MLVFVLAFSSPALADPTVPVVPLPREIVPGACTYTLQGGVTVQAHDTKAQPIATMLSEYLRTHAPSSGASPAGPNPAIGLSDTANDPQLGVEGYRLTIGGEGISIAANAPAGLFYGMQTLEQLLPATPAASDVLRCVAITDWPAYRWRGIHLDVSRHFFPVSVVEQYIDLAARYKLNVFHWHLTDDQGWRIQLLKYPKLTEIGDCRDGTQVGGEGSTATDGKRYCGYYTQDQIREVVAYAKARFVTVVPEIDMPGHSDAAIAAYPWLSCDGKQHAVRELWGVSGEVMCPTERTFGFINDEIGELTKLFPGPYIHIGGDEVVTDAWQASPFVHALMAREHITKYSDVQGYFERRVIAMVRAHGKQVIGWDDILSGGVPSGTTLMVWDDLSTAAKGAKKGDDAVINPDGPLYFDAAQGDQDFEPLSIGGLTTLEMVYDYDPMPTGLTPQQQAHIIGAQGDVWAEYIPTSDHLFYMLMPRELALAELCWTPRSQMDWFDFLGRIGPQLTRMEDEGLHFRIPDVQFSVAGAVALVDPHPLINETDLGVSASTGSVAVDLFEPMSSTMIHYTIDGSMPTAKSPAYQGTFDVPTGQNTTIAAIAVTSDGRVSAPAFLKLIVNGGPWVLPGSGK